MKHPAKPVRPPNAAPILVQQQSVHIGPLPDPETLQRYNDLLPGLAERIVAMAEAEQNERFRQEDHRHEESMLISRRAFRAERLGQIFAFLALLVLASAAVASVVLGAPSVGVALATATIGGVVASFLRARNKP